MYISIYSQRLSHLDGKHDGMTFNSNLCLWLSGVQCTDVPVSQMAAYPAGFTCAACPLGLDGDGEDCQGKVSAYALENWLNESLLLLIQYS